MASNKKFELTPLLPPAFDTGLLKARKLVTDFAAEVATGETDWLPDASLVADKSGHQLNSILLTFCHQGYVIEKNVGFLKTHKNNVCVSCLRLARPTC